MYTLPCTWYSVYESSASSKLTWRLSGNELQCISGKDATYSVRVLAEELAYNRALKQFKMFIVDRPLDPKYKVNSSAHVWGWK